MARNKSSQGNASRIFSASLLISKSRKDIVTRHYSAGVMEQTSFQSFQKIQVINFNDTGYRIGKYRLSISDWSVKVYWYKNRRFWIHGGLRYVSRYSIKLTEVVQSFFTSVASRRRYVKWKSSCRRACLLPTCDRGTGCGRRRPLCCRWSWKPPRTRSAPRKLTGGRLNRYRHLIISPFY